MNHCFTNVTRKARKKHKCIICGGEIQKGHMYLYRDGVCEDGFWHGKMHHLCETITQVWDLEWDERWTDFDNAETLNSALAPATQKQHDFWLRTGKSKYDFLY